MDSIYLPTRIPFWWKPRKKLNHCQSLNSGFRYGSARSNQQAQLTQHIDLRRLRERVMRSICFLAKNDVRGLQDSRRKVSIDLRPTALTQKLGVLRTMPTWTREWWRHGDRAPERRCLGNFYSSALSHIRMHSSKLMTGAEHRRTVCQPSPRSTLPMWRPTERLKHDATSQSLSSRAVYRHCSNQI